MIHFSHVSFGYHTADPLFSGFDWVVERGATTGLVGPNGAGKSTLLRLAAGLLAAQKGTVSIDGANVWPRTSALSNRVFYMSEDFALPAITVGQLGRYFAVFYPRFSASRFDELVERFALEKQTLIQKLSFGGVKKSLLAFGLSTGAELLLLDEPTNGLDPSAQEVLASELALAASEGATTIVATHHLQSVAPLLSHLVVLNQGKIILNASCQTLANTFRFGAVDPQHALYSRPSLGAHYGVERCAGCDSSLDLNLLYEAICNQPQLFTDLT